MSTGVLIVIPAWNEAKNLGSVIEEIRSWRPTDEIVVVDDGSADATGEAARRAGCHLLTLPFRLGYGGAVQAGVKYALRRGARVAVTFDADGQHDPRDLAALVQAVEEGADLALGSRSLAGDAYRGGPARYWGRRLFAGLAGLLTGWRLTDPTTGLKALGPRGQALFALDHFPDRFPDADALVLARRAGLVLAERPARMRPSLNRHSMHGGLRAVPYAFNMCLSLLVAAAGRDADLRG
jgi:hypothetical protein